MSRRKWWKYDPGASGMSVRQLFIFIICGALTAIAEAWWRS
jgi:hypothetical protein